VAGADRVLGGAGDNRRTHWRARARAPRPDRHITRGAEAIAAREQERDALRRQQATGDERARIAGLDPSRVAAKLTARLTEWDALLRRYPQQARQILKKLLAGRLVFDPFEDARGQGYVIRGQAASGRLITSGVRLGVPPG